MKSPETGNFEIQGFQPFFTYAQREYLTLKVIVCRLEKSLYKYKPKKIGFCQPKVIRAFKVYKKLINAIW